MGEGKKERDRASILSRNRSKDILKSAKNRVGAIHEAIRAPRFSRGFSEKVLYLGKAQVEHLFKTANQDIIYLDF